jgi:hypothetical protein
LVTALAKIIALHISQPDQIKHPYNAYQACFQMEIALSGIINVQEINIADMGLDLSCVRRLCRQSCNRRARPHPLFALIIDG